MKNSFLVTGATGFIGANLVRELVKREQHVSILTRSKKLNWRLADIAGKIDTYVCDILSPELGDVVGKIKPAYIFHLAAYGVLYFEEDLNKMIDINMKGTANLLNAVKRNPFKLMINTGSEVEYGTKDTLKKESDVLEPINDYGVTKAAATLYCQKEAIRNNLPIVTLRLFAPFGYYEDKNRLVPSVILSAITGKPIRVSSPRYVRDFIFIDDVIEAYMSTMKTEVKPGEILNIGTGKQHSVKEMVEAILQISGSTSEIAWGTVEKQARIIEPDRLEADISKSKSVLHWKPRASIDQGLEKAIDWFRQHEDLYIT